MAEKALNLLHVYFTKKWIANLAALHLIYTAIYAVYE